ncbi:protein argonaute-3-like [Panonychus citri]|uniref:protein argonaute-3-like n=1 Tax=Panonychus citri TaxID=50023 RepID=UPI0023070DE3|nr:protein argonaute-3-like [Panonychus citri]
MVNINQATAVLFKEGPLINSMCQLFKVESADQIRLDHRNIRMLDDLTYIRVETTYRGYSCPLTIRSFTSQSAGQLYFHDGNRRISVADYFVAHYKIHLNYPHLPCVEYGTQRYVPVELCHILPNQRNQRKLRDELIRIVSDHLRGQTPDIRCDDTKVLAEAVSRQCNNNNGFNIQLVPNQVEVESRILPAPKLSYSNDRQFQPIEGDWDMIKSRKTFLAPIELKRWGLIVLDERKIDGQICARFVDCLNKVGNLLGTLIDQPLITVLNIRIQDLEKHFDYLKERNAQLICVIMPERAEYYSRVKHYGDQVLGIPTQVVLSKHYNIHAHFHKLFDNSYLSNLLLKINLKLGGCNLKLNEASVINNRCSILTRKTMVVGIDVNHPSPGENSCSIAAVVGSIDEDFSRYRTVIEANAERDEIVRVDQMIVPILKKFKSSRGFDPEHIIVYRDGVSEGQFAHVMGYEILPLHKELSKLPKPPQLTYIIVQKRHNTRFYSKNPANRSVKTQNILPGSVIDTEICHYKWFDFYLCSQKALIGTARPGKYTVLWNSSPALADDLQMATYYLCYLFARATKSIADPAPARYAHHAAARGKLHFRELVNRGQVQQNEINIHLNNALNVDENLRNILYFS